MEASEIQPWPAGAWRRLLAEAITRADELIEAVGVSPAAGGGPSAAAAERQFGVRVPRGLAKRIRPADLSDPVLRQLPPAGVSDSIDGSRLIAGVRERMPGSLVPRLVREVAGAPSKVGVELREDG
jgi:L-lysine 2,3-aminomutase